MRYSGKIQAFNDFKADLREQRVAEKMRLVKGPPAPPVLSQKQRQAVVEQVQVSLGKWSLSPFEREGSTRAALRSAFCLGGNGWDAADVEAEKVTAMALAANGAKRPSWEEGQWTYAVSEDYCQWCQRPMELGHAGRYCSAECSHAALAHREFKDRTASNRAYMEVFRSVQRFATPPKECRLCKRQFHPRKDAADSQEYCSKSCHTKALNARAVENPSVAVCVVCHDEFKVYRIKGAKYCSTACQVTGFRMSKGTWEPKRLNKQVFEQLILGSSTPVIALLTPARFDDLLAAA